MRLTSAQRNMLARLGLTGLFDGSPDVFGREVSSYEDLNPIGAMLPTAVPATPVENTVQMDCETRHVSVARHSSAGITVLLPDVTDECSKGKVYAVTITSEEGASGIVTIKSTPASPAAELSDGVYLFSNVCGSCWAFQNDYEVWASFISLITKVVGEWGQADTESIADVIGTREDAAADEVETASLYALIKDLQARVGVLEGE